MTPADARVVISDVAVWFKHIEETPVLMHLEALEPEEEVTLVADDIVGRWRRMKTGKDGRPVNAIRPVGPMKETWNTWFRQRRGDVITLRLADPADDLLAASAALFSEWASPEDEAAFRDL